MSVTAVGDCMLSECIGVPEDAVCWCATTQHGVTLLLFGCNQNSAVSIHKF
jgi:hypothetical protein